MVTNSTVYFQKRTLRNVTRLRLRGGVSGGVSPPAFLGYVVGWLGDSLGFSSSSSEKLEQEVLSSSSEMSRGSLPSSVELSSLDWRSVFLSSSSNSLQSFIVEDSIFVEVEGEDIMRGPGSGLSVSCDGTRLYFS